jgi:hypothetical protein
LLELRLEKGEGSGGGGVGGKRALHTYPEATGVIPKLESRPFDAFFAITGSCGDVFDGL